MCEESGSAMNRDYSFKWSDYHGQFSYIVQELLSEGSMVDVTLAVAGTRIQAHRIVLSACSTLFQELLSQVPEENPVIILSEMNPQIIKLIVEYCYHGEVRVPTESINTLLEAAHLLKIVGLMDIEGVEDEDVPPKSDDLKDDLSLTRDDLMDDNFQNEDHDMNENSMEEVLSENESASKRKRKRRESAKREYSEDMLESAIAMLKSGKTLVEAATTNNIPRSTLYMRAKSLGLQMHASRSEYPAECMKAAIETVLRGSSLQQSADMYGIPKTVLWRRIQKEGFRILRTDCGKTYDSDKRQAAVDALARGENLTKVAVKYQIPKTTLFRDKIKLIGEGKLPVSFLKRRSIEDDATRKTRLDNAVAACKTGKMSQAVASATFQVPKTTIWRRLKQNKKKDVGNKAGTRKKVQGKVNEIKEDVLNFELCEVASHELTPLTYIDENDLPQESVIILTADEVDSLNLDNKQIIVEQDNEHDYISCHMALENHPNFSQSNSKS